MMTYVVMQEAYLNNLVGDLFVAGQSEMEKWFNGIG